MAHNQYNPNPGAYQQQPGGYQQQGYNPQTDPQPGTLSFSQAGTDLKLIFQKMDRDKSGKISTKELQEGLASGPFNPETVRLLSSMFDSDNNGSINSEEFAGLWKYVIDWQQSFRRFDRDNSGNIDQSELKSALTLFEFTLSDSFHAMLIRKFDRTGRGVIAFDDFIQCCVVLKMVTKSFKTKDVNKNGWIDVTYEELLDIVFSARS